MKIQKIETRLSLIQKLLNILILLVTLIKKII